MAQATPRIERIPRLSRLSWLMGLYAENYQHLVRLFAPAELVAGSYVSSVGDGWTSVWTSSSATATRSSCA